MKTIGKYNTLLGDIFEDFENFARFAKISPRKPIVYSKK